MKSKLSNTSVFKVKDLHDMQNFVDSLDIKTDTVIIKPNWVDGLSCSHTEVKALDMFMTALKKKVVIIESYTYWRTDKKSQQGNTDDYFSSSEATIETGKQHWQFFKDQDKWFLDNEGFREILKKHNAKYINITNEVWKENVIDSNLIKKEVGKKFSDLHLEKLYKYFPKKLYDLKGSTLISFAKAKKDKEYGLTLSIKNLFGLIPDPNRAVAGYHGNEDENLVPSIIDIHKIYQSFFDMRFVIDGVFTASEMDFETNTTDPYLNWGVIIGGRDALNVDLTGKELMKGEFKNAIKELSTAYKKEFGGSENIGEMKKDWYLNIDK